MKKILFFLSAICLLTTYSCSKDDENNTPSAVDYNTDIIGSWVLTKVEASKVESNNAAALALLQADVTDDIYEHNEEIKNSTDTIVYKAGGIVETTDSKGTYTITGNSMVQYFKINNENTVYKSTLTITQMTDSLLVMTRDETPLFEGVSPIFQTYPDAKISIEYSYTFKRVQ